MALAKGWSDQRTEAVTLTSFLALSLPSLSAPSFISAPITHGLSYCYLSLQYVWL